MNEIIEKLAYKIGEGYQASVLHSCCENVNAFHRTVVAHESTDISFVNGLVSTGLRGSALLDGEKLVSNYNQLLTASRQHLPIVVNTNAHLTSESSFSVISNYSHINAIQQAGCFQLVATSLQEEIFLTLIAHRIAELSLIPGIVIADYSESSEKVGIPSSDLIIQYLGNSDDQIECPTPSQKIIFGATRRRIPNWYSLDIPVMLGAKKDGEAISFEAAASQKYFHAHLPQLIKQAYQEFNTVFGSDIKPITVSGSSSENAIISVGGEINKRAKEGGETQFISVNQLYPFPSDAVKELLKNKKAVTILENSNGATRDKSAFYFNVTHKLNDSVAVYNAKFGSEINSDILKKVIEKMISNQPDKDYYLGLDFTKTASNYPKQDILLKEIGKQYPGIASETLNSQKLDKAIDKQSEIPLAVRMYQDKGPNYSRLSRFYDNTAFFYEHDLKSELVADPFTAIPAEPSVSASFFSQQNTRESLPIVDIQKCTGNGDNFVSCPHSALLPIAIGVEGLMKAGIDLAAGKGVSITKLTPMVKNLAKVAAKSIAELEISAVGDFLPKAFEDLTTQMNLEGEKLTTAQSEFNAVLSEIGFLPVAVTDTFFNEPNAQEKGSGELFSLAVNPSSCTGCGICAQTCDSISMESQNVDNLAKIDKQFKLWEQLPDTSSDTINRLFHDENYSSLAAMMLSRSYFMSMIGAGISESDNAYKTLLHIVTATTESVVQPKIVNQIKAIDTLIENLSENIHRKLSQALPKENLEQLAKSLKQAQGKKLSFQEIVTQVSDGENGKMIDTKLLSRKTDLVDSLKNLKWVLQEGPTGVGRSRYGMLIAGEKSMDWAKHYPANNFTSPSVIHWNGSAPEHTLGLFHGQLRYLLDNIKLMRRAELEAKDKYDSTIHDIEIADLNWDDLTDNEKKLVPPVLLIAEKDDLNESGWSSLNKLLVQKYPVKVFLFDNITSPSNSPVVSLTQTTSGMFSSMALKNAYVFQGGMGNVNHLFDGLMVGLEKSYPALFNLYATKFEKHGVTNIDWSPYASLALNSRAFPSFSFNPEEKNSFFNGAINLDGNNEIKSDWVEENIILSDEEAIKYKITWADWAFTQNDWKTEFKVVNTEDSNVLVADFIALDVKNRKSKTPVIIRAGINGIKHYKVSEKVIRMAEAVLSNWKTLQDLSGVSVKMPSYLKEEIIQEISADYEKQITALKKEYEKQLNDKEAAQTENLRQQLKEKLVELATVARN